jgi:hypothetical protein
MCFFITKRRGVIGRERGEGREERGERGGGEGKGRIPSLQHVAFLRRSLFGVSAQHAQHTRTTRTTRTTHTHNTHAQHTTRTTHLINHLQPSFSPHYSQYHRAIWREEGRKGRGGKGHHTTPHHTCHYTSRTNIYKFVKEFLF